MTAPTLVNPNEFKGYSVELLRGLKGMGPALVGDDALYAAAKEYNDMSAADVQGTVLGPALLTKDATQVIQSLSARQAPVANPAPVADETESASSWDEYELEELDAMCKKHGVTITGRVKTAGKLIAALEAAGVAP